MVQEGFDLQGRHAVFSRLQKLVSTLSLSFSGFMMAIWVWPVYPLAQVARSKIQLFLLFLHFADHAYTGKLFYVVLGSRLQIGQQYPPAMATVVPDLLQFCRCTTRNPFFKAQQQHPKQFEDCGPLDANCAIHWGFGKAGDPKSLDFTLRCDATKNVWKSCKRKLQHLQPSIYSNLISEYLPWLIYNQLADICKLSSHPNANVTAKKTKAASWQLQVRNVKQHSNKRIKSSNLGKLFKHHGPSSHLPPSMINCLFVSRGMDQRSSLIHENFCETGPFYESRPIGKADAGPGDKVHRLEQQPVMADQLFCGVPSIPSVNLSTSTSFNSSSISWWFQADSTM